MHATASANSARRHECMDHASSRRFVCARTKESRHERSRRFVATRSTTGQATCRLVMRCAATLLQPDRRFVAFCRGESRRNRRMGTNNRPKNDPVRVDGKDPYSSPCTACFLAIHASPNHHFIDSWQMMMRMMMVSLARRVGSEDGYRR
jgi:hypothetical protein